MPIRPKAECCQRFKLISGQSFSQSKSLGVRSTMAFFAEFDQSASSRSVFTPRELQQSASRSGAHVRVFLRGTGDIGAIFATVLGAN